MKQIFNFLIQGHNYSTTLSVENGMVTIGEYYPSFIDEEIGELNPLLKNMKDIQTITLEEYLEDCNFQIDYLNMNNLDIWDDNSIIRCLTVAVEKHINQYGRIFYTDLKCYVDVSCLIMKMIGYEEERIRAYYPQLIFIITHKFVSCVKEGSPLLGIIPFVKTTVWHIIEDYIQRTYF